MRSHIKTAALCFATVAIGVCIVVNPIGFVLIVGLGYVAAGYWIMPRGER